MFGVAWGALWWEVRREASHAFEEWDSMQPVFYPATPIVGTLFVEEG